MACGRPIVALCRGSLPEATDDGSSSFAVGSVGKAARRGQKCAFGAGKFSTTMTHALAAPLRAITVTAVNESCDIH